MKAPYYTCYKISVIKNNLQNKINKKQKFFKKL